MARFRDAVGKMILAFGKAVWMVSPLPVALVASKGGPNFAAKDPRPWRMMIDWRCSNRGGTIIGSGKTPGSWSFGFGMELALVSDEAILSVVVFY